MNVHHFIKQMSVIVLTLSFFIYSQGCVFSSSSEDGNEICLEENEQTKYDLEKQGNSQRQVSPILHCRELKVHTVVHARLLMQLIGLKYCCIPEVLTNSRYAWISSVIMYKLEWSHGLCQHIGSDNNTRKLLIQRDSTA